MDQKIAKIIRLRLAEFDEISRTSNSVFDFKSWAQRAYVLMNSPTRQIPWSDHVAKSQEFLSGFVGETDTEGLRLARNAASEIYHHLELQVVDTEVLRSDKSSAAADSDVTTQIEKLNQIAGKFEEQFKRLEQILKRYSDGRE